MRLFVTELGARLGGQDVLFSLTFELPARGLVALVGPNGSGKSTLLDVLGGLIELSTGTVRRDEHAASLTRAGRVRLCSRLHQVIVLPEQLTVREYLGLAAAARQGVRLLTRRFVAAAAYADFVRDHAAMAEVLEAAGATRDDLPIARFSWGQKRLIAAAAALAVDKPILLLDEPTAGLAGAVQPGLARVIDQERQRRLVVMAEHNIDIVMRLADRVLLLKQGRLAAAYGAGELKREELLRDWWGDGP